MTATIDRTVLIRGIPALAAAVLALILLLPPQAASAQVDLLEPGNPCVVDADKAPYADREKIANVHKLTVDCTFELGVSRGMMVDGERVFRPQGSTTRAQMASFVVQTLEAAGYDLPEASNQGFGDINGNRHEDNINRLAAAGIVNGVTDNRYAPGRIVRRDQMASFILQAATYAYNGTEFEALSDPGFADVLPTNVHRGNIAAAYELFGLVQGQSQTMYDPDAPTTRQQMATFLVRLIDITLRDGVLD